jgi:hypothetical protein
MQRDECVRYEEALWNEVELDAELAQHVSTCPDCCALVEIAALSAQPVALTGTDPLSAAIHEVAVAQAALRAARFERRRVRVPLLIGLAGYAIAALAFLAPVTQATQTAIPRLVLPDASTVPPPSLATVSAAIVFSALWVTGLLLYTRRVERLALSVRGYR